MPIDDTVDPWDKGAEGCLKPGYEQCERCTRIYDVEMYPMDITELSGVWLCEDCIEWMVRVFMHGK